MTPDVNVLLAASRVDHPHFAVASRCLNEAVAAARSGSGLVVLPMVITGFLRLATHPRIFREPTPTAAAVAFVDALLESPGVEVAELGREWPALRRLAQDHALVANDVQDAWIAAAVQSLGERLVTFDPSFKRLLGRSELQLLQPS